MSQGNEIFSHREILSNMSVKKIAGNLFPMNSQQLGFPDVDSIGTNIIQIAEGS